MIAYYIHAHVHLHLHYAHFTDPSIEQSRTEYEIGQCVIEYKILIA
jgi:hypothetical protein